MTEFGNIKLLAVKNLPDGVFQFAWADRVHSFRVESDKIIDLGLKVNAPVRVFRDGTPVPSAPV